MNTPSCFSVRCFLLYRTTVWISTSYPKGTTCTTDTYICHYTSSKAHHPRVHFLNGLFIKISESVLPPRLQRPSIPVNSNLARCLAHNLYLKHRWTKARSGIEIHKRAGLGHDKVNFSDIAHERFMAFMWHWPFSACELHCNCLCNVVLAEGTGVSHSVSRHRAMRKFSDDGGLDTSRWASSQLWNWYYQE